MVWDFWKWLAAILLSAAWWTALVQGELNDRHTDPTPAPITLQYSDSNDELVTGWVDACGVFHEPPVPTDIPLWYCPTPVPPAYP